MPQHQHYWKKWPDLDFNAAEEVSVFRIVLIYFMMLLLDLQPDCLDNISNLGRDL